MRCEDVRDVLAGLPDGSSQLDREQRRHVETCLRCQAEMVQYRRLLRAMRALRSEIAPPPVGLLGDLLATVEAAGERGAVRASIAGRRAAYLGGIAAATAAAGAGAAIVLVTRGRKGRFPLAG